MKYREKLYKCQVPYYISPFQRDKHTLQPNGDYVVNDPVERDYFIELAKKTLDTAVHQLVTGRNFNVSNSKALNRDFEQLYFDYLWHLHWALNTLIFYGLMTEKRASAYDFFYKRLYNHWFPTTKPTKPAKPAPGQFSLSLSHPRHRRLSREQQCRSLAQGKGKSVATLAMGDKARHTFALAKGKDDGVWDTHPLIPSQSGLFPLIRFIQVQHDHNHSPALA